ncbi:MAG: hypothetical protein WBH98_00675 [Bacteroidales bacterium]
MSVVTELVVTERSRGTEVRNAENGKLNSVSSSIAMSFKAWQLKLMHSEVLQLLTPNSILRTPDSELKLSIFATSNILKHKYP